MKLYVLYGRFCDIRTFIEVFEYGKQKKQREDMITHFDVNLKFNQKTLIYLKYV